MATNLEEAIARGLAYLRNTQQPNGSFVSYSSPTKQPFRQSIAYETTFAPALILNCLCSVPNATIVRTPLAAWLMNQKNDNWSFNYWATSAEERSAMPYPDDLDDT
ncbi:MAG TPA: hypothetical protein VMB52_04520, partial [Verrucomicrobiae bacterium]|nr:hypothetical protein [Verrucomicrobiae bacterium]